MSCVGEKNNDRHCGSGSSRPAQSVVTAKTCFIRAVFSRGTIFVRAQHFGLRSRLVGTAAFISQPAGRLSDTCGRFIVSNPRVPQQAASTKAAAGCRNPGSLEGGTKAAMWVCQKRSIRSSARSGSGSARERMFVRIQSTGVKLTRASSLPFG